MIFKQEQKLKDALKNIEFFIRFVESNEEDIERKFGISEDKERFDMSKITLEMYRKRRDPRLSIRRTAQEKKFLANRPLPETPREIAVKRAKGKNLLTYTRRDDNEDPIYDEIESRNIFSRMFQSFRRRR
ncbi:hypothetical protein EIN_333910 [Entamoeba invadens IP1]|uniref:Uncharacterized protein n=1 Tax=Entamoeba invadens IP1 TaxID=370355 RepID=A0A0A1UBC3_ENTIV|nr:hypothetical protein EIN_333910 [Entamoeba invadens IP1]ELP92424.1 hypothetical protein EIN_333910 [Entamoeba invadens IP1]|eukprot:XP_004259195.1 hypothetical protein EIN_333910 [Entamoeba invadens IP1]